MVTKYTPGWTQLYSIHYYIDWDANQVHSLLLEPSLPTRATAKVINGILVLKFFFIMFYW